MHARNLHWDGYDLGVVNGGTGASTGSDALTNLGVTAAAKTILDDASIAAIRTTLGVLQQIAVKKASNTTLTNATAGGATMSMAATIGASEWWQIRLLVLCTSPAADDLRLRLNVTGTLDVSFIGTWEGNVARRVHNTDYQILTDGNVQVFEFTGQVQGGASGGVLDIYAAKWTDTGADGTFYNDSNMVLTQVA